LQRFNRKRDLSVCESPPRPKTGIITPLTTYRNIVPPGVFAGTLLFLDMPYDEIGR